MKGKRSILIFVMVMTLVLSFNSFTYASVQEQSNVVSVDHINSNEQDADVSSRLDMFFSDVWFEVVSTGRSGFKVSMRNMGKANAYNVTIHYSLDGGVQRSYNLGNAYGLNALAVGRPTPTVEKSFHYNDWSTLTYRFTCDNLIISTPTRTIVNPNSPHSR